MIYNKDKTQIGEDEMCIREQRVDICVWLI